MCVTLRMAHVPLAHSRMPPDSSDEMLFFISTCLKSDSLSSLTNTELCGGMRSWSSGTRVSTFLLSSSTSSVCVCERDKKTVRFE